jgi:hypothetical protein
MKVWRYGVGYILKVYKLEGMDRAIYPRYDGMDGMDWAIYLRYEGMEVWSWLYTEGIQIGRYGPGYIPKV